MVNVRRSVRNSRGEKWNVILSNASYVTFKISLNYWTAHVYWFKTNYVVNPPIKNSLKQLFIVFSYYTKISIHIPSIEKVWQQSPHIHFNQSTKDITSSNNKREKHGKRSEARLQNLQSQERILRGWVFDQQTSEWTPKTWWNTGVVSRHYMASIRLEEGRPLLWKVSGFCLIRKARNVLSLIIVMNTTDDRTIWL